MAYRYAYDDEEVKYEAPKLQTNRNVWKFIILNILTFGIYGIIFFIPFSFDLDKIAPKRDGTKTMNYLFAYILSYITLSVVMMVWFHHITERVEEALREREIDYEFGTGDFWGWYFFGSFILVGPYVYLYKLISAMNLLCEDYNKENEQNKLLNKR